MKQKFSHVRENDQRNDNIDCLSHVKSWFLNKVLLVWNYIFLKKKERDFFSVLNEADVWPKLHPTAKTLKKMGDD